MEHTVNFECFSNGLSLLLVRDMAACELRLNDHIAEDFSGYRLIDMSYSGVAMVSGDGLNLGRIKSHVDIWFEKLRKTDDSSMIDWNYLTLLYVFENGCPDEIRNKMLTFHRSVPFFSFTQSKSVYVGFVDLQTKILSTKGLPSWPVRKVLADLSRGESVIDRKAYEEEIGRLAAQINSISKKVDKRKAWGTWAIAGVSIILFIWMSLAGGTENTSTLLRFSANSSLLVEYYGEWWRLSGALFLHSGIWHLLMNVVALLFIGITLEKYLGHIRYLALFAITGIMGSLASQASGLLCSIGASGSIFGFFGASVVTGWRYKKEIPSHVRIRLGGVIVALIIYNLIYGIIQPEIDNMAHIAGLLGGILFAFIFKPDVISSKDWTSSRPVVLLLALVAFSPFMVEVYVINRALTVGGVEYFPRQNYRQDQGRYTLLYPYFLRVHRLWVSKPELSNDSFRAPGIRLKVYSYLTEKEMSIEECTSTMESFLDRSSRFSTNKQYVMVARGNRWLCAEGIFRINGLDGTVAVTPIGRKLYRIDMSADRNNYQDGLKIMDIMIQSFQVY